MAKSEPSTGYPHRETALTGDLDSDHDLKVILDAISAQLSDADRRHSATLNEMQDRIAGVARETEMLRQRVPQEFAPAFDRIETGVAELSERIAEVSGGRSAADPNAETPMPLRSAAEPKEADDPRREAEAADHARDVDTFDVVGSSLPGDAADPWDHEAAEALTGLYESGAANIHANAAQDRPDQTQPHGTRPAGEPDASSGSTARLSAHDQSWLENRFAEIAKGIEQSLADIRPDHGFFAMGHRLDQFEEHVEKLLGGVTAHADLSAIRSIESHVADVASQLVHTNDQLARLNAIEDQLNGISKSLTEMQGGAHFARAADTNSAADELRPLIERLMSENRRGGENTAALLDTLQHAMIRLLDRVEAIEAAQRQSFAPDAVADEDVLDELPADEPAEPRNLRDSDTRAALDAAVAAVASEVVERHWPEAPEHVSVATPATVSKAEMLRQDFVADARRARMRLAEEQDHEVILQAPGAAISENEAGVRKAPDEKRGSRPIRTPRAASTKTEGPSGPSARLMIIVVAAILILAGLWYMLGTEGGQPDPAQPANSQLVPSDAGSKGSSAQSNGSEGAQDADGPRGDATPMRDGDGRIIPSSVPEGGTKLPMPGVAVDLGRSTTKKDIQYAERHQAMAKISGELGDAAARRSETAVLPATMIAAEDEALGLRPERSVDKVPAGMVRSVPLDMPDAKIGPLSLRLAAAHGDPSAEFEVGARFAEGKGVPQNFKEAAKWYQNSADKGFAQAEYRLGTLYERGLGVKTDRSRAAAWYQRAAEKGNIKAMHNLAVLSADQTDDSPDYVTAAHWFEEAAKRGLIESQFNLAVLYENGLGVKADMTRAYMWLSLAARAGDKDAVHRLPILRGKLTADQIASAGSMVENWKPLPANRIINNARVAGELWKKNPKNGVSG